MSDEVTIEILKSIRDEIRGTNARIDGLDKRLETTNERIDHLEHSTTSRLERLEKRQVETEIRLATEIVAVAGAVDHEKRLSALEKRVRR